MLDFNDAVEQKEMSGHGPIPKDSIVLFQMEIRQPPSNKELEDLDQSDPKRMWITKSGTGNNHYLDCEFTVLSPSFDGKRVWQKLTQIGTDTACRISNSFLRAVLEANRGIMPNDASPAAVEARKVSGYQDFNGLKFPGVVGYEKINPGDKFINNNIKRVVTPDKEEFAAMQEDMEIISDNPIPEIPQAGQTTASQPAKTGWGAAAATGGGGQAAQAEGMPQNPARKW